MKNNKRQLYHYLQLGRLSTYVCNLRLFTIVLPLLKGNSYRVRASDIIAFAKVHQEKNTSNCNGVFKILLRY